MDIIKAPDDVEHPKPVVFNQGKVYTYTESMDKSRESLLRRYVEHHIQIFGKVKV